MATYKQIGYGSTGSDVTELQKLLNNYGYNLSVDGIFGANTQTAVKDYQKKNGLAVDGIVGTNTWGALTSASTKPSAPSSSSGSSKGSGGYSSSKGSGSYSGGSKGSGSYSPTTGSGSGSSTGGFNYGPFTESQSTIAADKNRQEIESQKPGDFTYDEYEKSDVVKQAEALLQQHLANKPGEYQSQWQTQLDETLNKILNREKFSYDLNGDALYQQYKDQYNLQGQQAMMDTMGHAQAMTGGYANSYAQTVGQQTYQGYMQQLNDKVPELYQIALNQYNREGEDLYNQYGMYADREDRDYGRYRDQIADYYTELDRLTNDSRYQSETEYNRYMDAYNKAYGEYRDSVADWQNALNRADSEYWNQYNRDYTQYSDDRNLSYDNYWNEQNMAYQKERDRIADQQWQAEFNEAVRQFNQQYALQASAASGGSSGGSYSGGGSSGGGGSTYTSSSSSSGYNNSGYSTDLVKKAQAFVGTTVDGAWGANSTAAAKAKGYGSLAAVLNAMGYTSVGALAGNQKTSNPTPAPAPKADFKSVTQDLNDLIASGANKSEIGALVNSALASGIITSAQATSLKNTFVPRGLTY